MAERKYFLDWLRVTAFTLLILFHVGMLYVSWTYNLKSPRLFPELEWVMLTLTPWRLALLFFVSGVASRFLLIKLGKTGFFADRMRRLLPVFIVGMIFINPWQTYVELLEKGLVADGPLVFWLNSYLTGDPQIDHIMPRWDHLWFLLYLIVYLLIFSAVLVPISWPPFAEKALHKWLSPYLWGPGLWLAASYLLAWYVWPITHSLINDWAGHLRWGGMFALGMVSARHDRFWEATERFRYRSLLIAFITLVGIGMFRSLALQNEEQRVWASGLALVQGCYGWTMILVLCGFARRWFNRPSPTLTYLNTAILPVYVLHQPVLLVAAFFMFPLGMPLIAETVLLLSATMLLPLALYEVAIRRLTLVRVLFGLKPLTA